MKIKDFFAKLKLVVQFLSMFLMGGFHGFESRCYLCILFLRVLCIALIFRIISHILSDFHRTEFRSAHRTTMR